jgi:hypothetical protein
MVVKVFEPAAHEIERQQHVNADQQRIDEQFEGKRSETF